MFFFDPTFILLIPALLLALWAQIMVQSNFSKYSNVRSRIGMTGSELARFILDSAGLYDVRIESIPGTLTDHYDPRTKVVRLSQSTYNSYSVAALGVVAHEIGHAIQHANHYVPLVVRNAIAPVASFSSNLAWIFFIIGIFTGAMGLAQFGILLFLAVVLFSIITLPVEFNASSRALKILERNLLMSKDELKGVKAVLSAAAMTYVADTLMAIMQLIRMLLIARNRD
ncbi:zinc metallopeptidase [Fervidobacterium nodosum]|uniref:Peptidase membrane zinc metallopeptidase putative n=1 Tax=Fervidobacterium nodosum (strain ATCC 35602 / DSM 5306 / Rt17-B1) TaxID=381764 RepID=A7HMC1_FERNB|nr:zinc metallopeptidase [Fervidobacterium nodosum]ABS61054.1 peptidase membrane zinc metallopeptidase putative [Fervidobacterium nodosum Rt17-B1]PHJ13908.1 peptidase [Fervidobacterium sp. SC_NGM5_G05]